MTALSLIQATVEPGQVQADWRLVLAKILQLNTDWVSLDSYCPAGALGPLQDHRLDPARMVWLVGLRGVRRQIKFGTGELATKHVVLLGTQGVEYMRLDSVGRAIGNKAFGWRLDRQTLNKVATEARLP